MHTVKQDIPDTFNDAPNEVRPGILTRMNSLFEKYFLALGLPAGVALLLYSRVLALGVQADDFNHLEHLSRLQSFGDYLGLKIWIRPLELWINTVNSALLNNDSFIFSHAVSLSLYLLCTGLLVHICKKHLKMSAVTACMTGLVFAVHPSNMMAVSQIDTISQILSGIAGLLLFATSAEICAHPEKKRYQAEFVACLLLALCSKESTLGMAVAAPLLLLFFQKKYHPPKNSIYLAAGSIALLCVYVAVRLAFRGSLIPGVSCEDMHAQSRYQIGGVIGWGKNTALYMAGCLFQGNLAAQLTGAGAGATIAAILVTLIFTAFSAIGGYHLYKSLDLPKTTRLLLAVFLVSSPVPSVFCGRVSELYVFNTTPFVSILFATGVVALTRTAGRLRQIAVVTLLITLAQGALMTNDKLTQLSHLDTTYRHYLTEIQKVSRNNDYCVSRHEIKADNKAPQYSVLVQRDISVINRIVAYLNTQKTYQQLVIRENDGACAIRVAAKIK